MKVALVAFDLVQDVEGETSVGGLHESGKQQQERYNESAK